MSEPVKGDPDKDEKLLEETQRLYGQFKDIRVMKNIKKDYLKKMKYLFEQCIKICDKRMGDRDNQSEGGKKNKKTE